MRSKLMLVIGAGVAIVAYLLVRPSLAAGWPYIHLAEFPIAIVVVGALLWGALRVPRDQRPPPPVEWRRHEQKVRDLPDPEAQRLRAPLGAWVEGGEGADEAADVLARATARDATERDDVRARLADEMRLIKSPRKRAAFLKSKVGV